MNPSQQWSVSAPWAFRDTEYTVSADVRDDVLVVEVEEKLTANQWSGQFEAKHIEELTRKTGNFKQFPIFLNMLESAITKSSDCVTLDLLTYSDLEALRNKKLGVRGSSPAKSSRQLLAKRYLILTYSVEFDREKPAPNVGQRQMCYVARDAFYECKAKHNEEEAPCEELKRAYHSNCLTSWVKYFDKKRVYEEYKKKLENEGFQPLPSDGSERR